MEDNLSYSHINSKVDFAHGIYRKIYTDSQGCRNVETTGGQLFQRTLSILHVQSLLCDLCNTVKQLTPKARVLTTLLKRYKITTNELSIKQGQVQPPEAIRGWGATPSAAGGKGIWGQSTQRSEILLFLFPKIILF